MTRIELVTSSLPRKCSTTELQQQVSFARAEDGAQTRDPQLGRLVLYQLSYFRKLVELVLPGGRRWIRTTEGVRQQIYSLPHLATLVSALFGSLCSRFLRQTVSKRLQRYALFLNHKNFFAFFYRFWLFSLFFCS